MATTSRDALLPFNSHPHKEDDSRHRLQQDSERSFNSHPHKEDDFHLEKSLQGLESFNSHPHKEDDYIVCRGRQHIYLSTHILTRRMTVGL